MKQKTEASLQQRLQSFERVWQRVTDSRSGPAALPETRPEGLMPKKERRLCCQRWCRRP